MLLPLHTRTSLRQRAASSTERLQDTATYQTLPSYKQFVLKTQYLGVVLYFLQKKHVI